MKNNSHESLDKKSRIALTILIITVVCNVILIFVYEIFGDSIALYSPHFYINSFQLLSFIFFTLLIIALVYGIRGAGLAAKEKKVFANLIWIGCILGVLLNQFIWIIFMAPKV